MPTTEQIQISQPFSLAINLGLMIIVTAMFGYIVWHAIFSDDKLLIHGLDGAPPWVAWLIFVPFCAFVEFMLARLLLLRRVDLIGDQLRISSLTTSFEVSIQDVDQVYWIKRPTRSDTPKAALTLLCPSPFGREIRFLPRSEAMVELIQQRVESGRA
jgi:hypothetical protein